MSIPYLATKSRNFSSSGAVHGAAAASPAGSSARGDDDDEDVKEDFAFFAVAALSPRLPPSHCLNQDRHQAPDHHPLHEDDERTA